MAYQVCASAADCEDSWVLSFSSKRFLQVYGTPSAPVIVRSLSHCSSPNARRSCQVNSLARGLSKNRDPRSRVESSRISLAGLSSSRDLEREPRTPVIVIARPGPSLACSRSSSGRTNRAGGCRRKLADIEKQRKRDEGENEKEKPRESRWHRPPRGGRLWRFIRVVRDVFFVEIITGPILTDPCVPAHRFSSFCASRSRTQS